MKGECEDVRGEWGGICPGCGQRLPDPPAVRSWMATRPMPDGVRWDGSPVQPGHEKRVAARRERTWSPPRTGRGRAPSLFMPEVAEALRLARGNVTTASTALGCARQSVLAFLNRNRAEIPADVDELVAVRRRPRRIAA